MLRKVLAATLVLLIAGYAVGKTEVGSYLRTAWREFREDAHKQVSIEFEIKNLRDKLNELEPDIKRAREAVAQEKVEVDNLREDVNYLQARFDQQKADIRHVSTELKNGATTISLAKQELPADRATERLDQLIDSAERGERTLASKKRILTAREKMLETSMKNLFAMRDEKGKLEEQLTELEAAYREVQLQQTQSKYQFDDTRLAKIKKSMESLKNRVKVQKADLDLANQMGGTNEEKGKNKGDVLNRADRLLNGGDKGKSEVAEK